MIKLIDILKEGIFGDYLFADEKSGVEYGLYDKELEKDTPEEYKLFQDLKLYAAGGDFEDISLDKHASLLKQLKKEYPSFIKTNLSPEDYIYRGTVIFKDKLIDLIKEKKIIKNKASYTVSNIPYTSKKIISSWSSNFFAAHDFAYETLLRKKNNNFIPAVLRVKVKEADVYFKDDFFVKISDNQEWEVLNMKQPINVDMVIQRRDINNIKIRDKNELSFAEELAIKRIKDYIKQPDYYLYISNLPINEIPKELKLVKDDFFADNTPIKSLPDNLEVQGDLYLRYSAINILPKNLKVKGNLNLEGTPLSKKYSQEELKKLLPGVGGEIIT